MKARYIISLAAFVAAGSVCASMTPILASTVDVAAGRNLRNKGMRFCSINFEGKHAQNSSSAIAMILLPKYSRLLDTKIISRSKTKADCGRTKTIGENNVVSCKLTRLSPNKEVILRARYHQKIPTNDTCTAYIEAS